MTTRTAFPLVETRLKRNHNHWWDCNIALHWGGGGGLMDQLFGRVRFESGGYEGVSFDFPEARYSVQEEGVWVTSQRLI